MDGNEQWEHNELQKAYDELCTALADLRETALVVTSDILGEVVGSPVSVIYYAKKQLLKYRAKLEAEAKTNPMNWCDTCTDFVDMKIQTIGEGVNTDYICTCPICSTTTIN